MRRFQFCLSLLFAVALNLCFSNTISIAGDKCRDSYVDKEYPNATNGSAAGLDVQI